MAKQLNKREIDALDSEGMHRVDRGLYIRIDCKGDRVYRYWRVRHQIGGKRQWATLGKYPDLTIAEARQMASELVANVTATQRTPTEIMADARAEKKANLASSSSRVEGTFRQVAEQYLEQVKRLEWKKSTKTEKEWLSRFERLIFPVIGDKMVTHITTDDVLEIVRPIWMTTHETADRCRFQISAVIDYAIAMRISDRANPAAHRIMQNVLPPWKGQEQHWAALPFEQLPAFWNDLCAQQAKAEKKGQSTASHEALKILILTACRSLDVRSMKWDDLDLDRGEWNAIINKATTNVSVALHKVTLPKAAHDILSGRMQEAPTNEFVFAGLNTKTKHVTEAAVRKQLRALGYTDAFGRPITIHGFRSCFMDWVRVHNVETTEVADQQLAHSEKDTVLAAYARSDLVARRATMMQKYAAYALGLEAPALAA